jgi:hypothetical protein
MEEAATAHRGGCPYSGSSDFSTELLRRARGTATDWPFFRRASASGLAALDPEAGSPRASACRPSDKGVVERRLRSRSSRRMRTQVFRSGSTDQLILGTGGRCGWASTAGWEGTAEAGWRSAMAEGAGGVVRRRGVRVLSPGSNATGVRTVQGPRRPGYAGGDTVDGVAWTGVARSLATDPAVRTGSRRSRIQTAAPRIVEVHAKTGSGPAAR